MEKTYLGNPNLKAANQRVRFTKKQVEEFLRCQDNPIYFIENYLQIEKWIRSLGFPESLAESIPLDPNEEDLLMGARSDGTLLIYNSSFNPIAKILFKDMFPVSLTPVPFSADATDINYIMATATFKYTIFNVESLIENES